MTEMIGAAWSALDVNTSLVLLLVKATVLLLAATIVTLAMRRATAGTRHLIWLVALASLFLVPVLSTWTPVRMAVLPPMTAAVDQALTDARQSATNVVPPSAIIDVSAPAPAPGAAAAHDAGARLSLFGIILTVWVLVALALLALLARAAFVVNRIVRRSTPLDVKDWLDPLYEVSDRLNLDEPPRLVRSAEAKMPFACGLIRPTIVLPPECDLWSPERRRAVMLHELAHVRRRDLVGHLVGRLACAIYWFHPLVWAAAKRLRSESERACDDIALASGARATDYAEHLLDIVTSVRRDRTPAVAMAMAQRREFEGRMLAILDPEIPRSLPDRRRVGTLVGTFALLAISIGAAVPAQRAPDAAPVTLGSPEAETPATMLQAPPQHDSDDDEQFDVRSDMVASEGSATAAVAATAGVASSGSAASATQTPDERADLLARVLRTDTSATLRRIAAWGLHEHIEADAAVPALTEALRRDPSASVREMAAWALHDAEDDHTAIAALSAAVRGDADPRVRASATWSLGNGGSEAAAEALTAALRDESASVRMRAVWGLGQVEPRSAPPALVAMLRDRDRDVRMLTAWALYSIEDPATIDALQAAMRTETDVDLRFAYIRALAALGEESVDAIRDLLDSPDQRLKSLAVRALAGGKATGPWPWPWPEPRPFP